MGAYACKVLAKYPQVRALAYADDGYIKAKMSEHVRSWLMSSTHEDAGLDLNVSKTSFLPKGVSQQAAFDVTQNIITNSPTLATLSRSISLASFCAEGFVGIGVEM